MTYKYSNTVHEQNHTLIVWLVGGTVHECTQVYKESGLPEGHIEDLVTFPSDFPNTSKRYTSFNIQNFQNPSGQNVQYIKTSILAGWIFDFQFCCWIIEPNGETRFDFIWNDCDDIVCDLTSESMFSGKKEFTLKILEVFFKYS